MRNRLNGVPDQILRMKTSNYNNLIYVDHCDKTINDEQLDVHHIVFQSECNEYERKDHVMKNMKGNLVVLCKTHHREELEITGWKLTSEGMELDFHLNFE